LVGRDPGLGNAGARASHGGDTEVRVGRPPAGGHDDRVRRDAPSARASFARTGDGRAARW
jgi:hypothetical protein